MTINLKDYANKLVVVTLRNELMLVSLVNISEKYHNIPYVIDGRHYSIDGRCFFPANREHDIIDIVLADEEPEPIITRVEVITHEEGRVYVNWKKDNKITTSLQDDGKTLKIFVTQNAEETMYPKQPKPINMVEIETKRWATALSNFINELGGDSHTLWEWGGITPTPEKVVECLRGLIKYREQSAADAVEEVSKPTSYDGIYTSAERETSKQWATALSNFIDELGGDSPFLWEWNEITPTPEKVVECLRELVDFHMTTAADNELDECCELISKRYSGCTYERRDTAKVISTWMRNTRRPQPTLKSQALKDFETVRKHSDLLPEILDNIENALKSIPE
jgi:hypothetical protein